jgi:hypothetical protein
MKRSPIYLADRNRWRILRHEPSQRRQDSSEVIRWLEQGHQFLLPVDLFEFEADVDSSEVIFLLELELRTVS